MSILDYYCNSSRKVKLLDETLRDDLHQHIIRDLQNYNVSIDKWMYTLSSYGLTLTLSQSKMLRCGVNQEKEDPYHLHLFFSQALKKYIRRFKSFECLLYPDFGKSDQRYHLHGYYFGDYAPLVAFLKHYRKKYGFAVCKQMFGDPDIWFKYANKPNIGMGAIQLIKTLRRQV